MTYIKSYEPLFSIHLLYISAFYTSNRCLLLLAQLHCFEWNICSTEDTEGIVYEKKKKRYIFLKNVKIVLISVNFIFIFQYMTKNN